MLSKRMLFSTLVAVSLMSAASFARLRHDWTFEELKAKSDLVVIVKMESSRISGEKWKSPYTTIYRGRTTTFSVNGVLKGNLTAKSLEVLTFEYLEGDVVPSGPIVIHFRGDGDGGLVGPQYLMFLSKTDDGRYEPVSGRADPDLSVKELGEAEHEAS